MNEIQNTSMKDGNTSSSRVGLSSLLDRAARLAGQRVDRSRLDDLDRMPDRGGDQSGGGDAAALFAEMWCLAQLDGIPLPLFDPTPADFPFVAHAGERGWVLLLARGLDGTWRGESATGEALSLPDLNQASCISLPRRSAAAKNRPNALGLVLRAMGEHKVIFRDAILATGLVSLLSLATSLYAMQVYDRVIPHHGFNTLWVLSVGVVLSIFFEFLLKLLRSHIVDRTCNAIDHQLSEWFFSRMLGIRMEARPPSVGTLASQVKGFEMVRGVLASTSLFVMADVPFALFFLLIIAMVGGWVAVVPLIAMPIALLVGVMFQGAIQRYTRQNLSASNRKAGLLVEAVDGAETLKSNGGEWAIQSRWNHLVDQTSAAEQGTRNLTALSQNLTIAFQQLAYIALVAVGAYFVAENKLTMGALIACSIIGSRAMTPIVQLPGVMVQWALARTALDGLEQIITMANEADDAHAVLMPETLEGSFRIERARFVYGMTKRVALEVERLEIRAGERIGLIGPIGSGKSTLLKLVSGLYRPVEGKVFLGGVDLASLAPAVAREMIGYLPQEVRLFSGTLRDNLLLGLPDPGEEAILAAAKRTGLIDLVLGQPMGLSLELTEGGRGVSGGQKQLIAMTRMLLARPKVWLLDEPTGAMDSTTESRVVNLLRELAAEGATIIVSTHKTALLPMLDRLVMLQAGRIQLDGPRDAVLARVSGKPQALAQESHT